MSRKIMLIDAENDVIDEIKDLLKRRGYETVTNDKTAGSYIDNKIMLIFMAIGIPSNLKGYQYLREAVKMTINEPDVITQITTRIYPELAKRFHTSPSNVERSMRHAIETAWERGKKENIDSLFGLKIYDRNEKPTNSEFIALIADKLVLDD